MTGYNERSKSSMRSDFYLSSLWEPNFLHIFLLFHQIQCLTFWGAGNLALRHIIFWEEKVKFKLTSQEIEALLIEIFEKEKSRCSLHHVAAADVRLIDLLAKKVRVAHLREKTWWSLGSYERCAMMQNWPSLNHINHKIHLPITYK